METKTEIEIKIVSEMEISKLKNKGFITFEMVYLQDLSNCKFY